MVVDSFTIASKFWINTLCLFLFGCLHFHNANFPSHAMKLLVGFSQVWMPPGDMARRGKINLNWLIINLEKLGCKPNDTEYFAHVWVNFLKLGRNLRSWAKFHFEKFFYLLSLKFSNGIKCMVPHANMLDKILIIFYCLCHLFYTKQRRSSIHSSFIHSFINNLLRFYYFLDIASTKNNGDRNMD